MRGLFLGYKKISKSPRFIKIDASKKKIIHSEILKKLKL